MLMDGLCCRTKRTVRRWSPSCTNRASAEYPYAEFQRRPEVTLPEWGRVEGRTLWGDKPGANQKVSLGDRESRTDNDGRFVFERVAPGRLALAQPIELPQPRDDGISSVERFLA